MVNLIVCNVKLISILFSIYLEKRNIDIKDFTKMPMEYRNEDFYISLFALVFAENMTWVNPIVINVKSNPFHF